MSNSSLSENGSLNDDPDIPPNPLTPPPSPLSPSGKPIARAETTDSENLVIKENDDPNDQEVSASLQ